jgi:hypothetical protein
MQYAYVFSLVYLVNEYHVSVQFVLLQQRVYRVPFLKVTSKCPACAKTYYHKLCDVTIHHMNMVYKYFSELYFNWPGRMTVI